MLERELVVLAVPGLGRGEECALARLDPCRHDARPHVEEASEGGDVEWCLVDEPREEAVYVLGDDPEVVAPQPLLPLRQLGRVEDHHAGRPRLGELPVLCGRVDGLNQVEAADQRVLEKVQVLVLSVSPSLGIPWEENQHKTGTVSMLSKKCSFACGSKSVGITGGYVAWPWRLFFFFSFLFVSAATRAFQSRWPSEMKKSLARALSAAVRRF